MDNIPTSLPDAQKADADTNPSPAVDPFEGLTGEAFWNALEQAAEGSDDDDNDNSPGAGSTETQQDQADENVDEEGRSLAQQSALSNTMATATSAGREQRPMKEWTRNGNLFALSSNASSIERLPAAVYVIHEDQRSKQLYLEIQHERFEFPFKVYGLQDDLVARIKRTYSATETNLGVILNGLKGTGKSVTAEIIANEMINKGLPVILVTQSFEGLVGFMNEFQQDAMFLFEEFEKAFKRESYDKPSKILAVMDGVLNTRFRKVFVMTTNELTIESNLISRPGRIRYLKTFRNLELNQIIEIVDDKLLRKAHRDAVIQTISQLSMITVDIVSSIVNETNIHNEAPDKFMSVFNVTKIQSKVDLYETKLDDNGVMKEVLYMASATQSPANLNPEMHIGFWVEYSGQCVGKIIDLKDIENGGQVFHTTDMVAKKDKDGEDTDKEEQVIRTFRTTPKASYHSAFSAYFN